MGGFIHGGVPPPEGLKPLAFRTNPAGERVLVVLALDGDEAGDPVFALAPVGQPPFPTRGRTKRCVAAAFAPIVPPAVLRVRVLKTYGTMSLDHGAVPLACDHLAAVRPAAGDAIDLLLAAVPLQRIDSGAADSPRVVAERRDGLDSA
jgi:hypothetical protein